MANMKQSGTAQKKSASLEEIRRRSFFVYMGRRGVWLLMQYTRAFFKHAQNRQEENDYGRL